MGFNSYDNDDVSIKGVNGSGTSVYVDVFPNANGGYSVVPNAAHKPAYFNTFLTSNGAKNMSVDGSSTSKDFTAGPAVGEIWAVKSIALLLYDKGDISLYKFGNLNSLTNGFQILQSISSTEYEYGNYKDKSDLIMSFCHGQTSFVENGDSFLKEKNVFCASLRLDPPLLLYGDAGDKIIGRVRDNLTGIEDFYMSLQYYRDLG